MQTKQHNQVYTLQDRLKLIAKQIDVSMKQPQVTRDNTKYMIRDLALWIVKNTPQHGVEAEDEQVKAIFWWIKNNIQYRQDPRDYDLYMSAGRTISAGGSDCDDHAILNCAMLSSIGFATGAKVISPDGNNWHIYAVVGVHPFGNPSELIALDTTQPGSYPGWEPDMGYRQHEYLCTFSAGSVLNLTKIRG